MTNSNRRIDVDYYQTGAGEFRAHLRQASAIPHTGERLALLTADEARTLIRDLQAALAESAEATLAAVREILDNYGDDVAEKAVYRIRDLLGPAAQTARETGK